MKDAPIISFRRVFAGEVEHFLREEGLGFDDVVPAICELTVLLARSREEGIALFPEVFLCEDLEATLHALGGFDALTVGSGSLDAEGMRGAMKRAAPLSSPGWSIFMVREGSAFRYGVFRTDMFVLHPTAMDRLRAMKGAPLRLLGFSQLEENVIEIRASSGAARRVYLSGARMDSEPGPTLVERLVHRIGAGSSDARAALRGFWRHVLVDELRGSHGMLLAIVREGDDVRARFCDAAHLDPRIDVEAHVGTYLAKHDEHSRAAVAAAAGLIRRMLRADGITVVTDCGNVIAYNAFVAHRHEARGGARSDGGARRRTYATLAALASMDDGLVGAFFRSQDGAAELTLPMR